MAWFGKIVGGTVGLFMGGPLGAVAGAAMGAIYDSQNPDTVNRGQWREVEMNNVERAQLLFFAATFSMLGKLAKADGRVTPEEVENVSQFMREIRLEGEQLRFAKEIFNQSKSMDVPFEALARQYYQVSNRDHSRARVMIDIMLRVAMADGEYHPEEERLIHTAARIFNIDKSEFERLKGQYVKDNSRYYAILDCAETDSDEVIKRKYRQLVSEYHPDKIASKGLPEEFMELANKKLQEFNEAYSQIKKSRGM